jgi:tetratricopeptide (TPR) repeat protein
MPALLVGLLATLLQIAPTPGASANAAPHTPSSATQALLDYAQSVAVTGLPDENSARDNLRALRRELDEATPPATDCARALGARRYAALYRDMALASETLGDFRGASQLLLRALDCAPRDAGLLGAYAADLLALRQFAPSRAVLLRALDIDRSSFVLRSILLRLEFHEQHWSAVMELANQLLAEDDDDSHWVYWQLLGQVAALRGALAPPVLPKRKMGEDWPVPLWRAINGQLPPAHLRQDFELAADERERRQKICEAMFYLGEVALARGDSIAARRHFAMATRMKILDYIEHDLALGELARLRSGANSGADLPRAAHDILVAR